MRGLLLCVDAALAMRDTVALKGLCSIFLVALFARRRLSFLTTCSDDSKPYMILVALVNGFQNHIGFAMLRASGED